MTTAAWSVLGGRAAWAMLVSSVGGRSKGMWTMSASPSAAGVTTDGPTALRR